MSAVAVVRYKTGKHQFEVLVKPNSMAEFREGKLSADEVLAHDTIFKSSAKGEHAPEAELSAAFSSKPDNKDRLLHILKHGEYQMSAHERVELTEKKRHDIVAYIHKHYADPQSKKPYPVERIQAALEQTKFHIQYDRDAERQALEAISKLVEVIPLKRTEISGTLTIPHSHLGQAQGIVKKHCEIDGEQYGTKGCTMKVHMTPGDYEVLIAELSRICKGDYVFHMEGQHGASAASTDDGSKSKGKKGAKGKE